MPTPIGTYVETGARRVFAGALDWPGWCRSAGDEQSALDALVAYAPRYERALRGTAKGWRAPTTVDGLIVVERVRGNATTDFGAPGIAPSLDDEPLDRRQAKRLIAVLESAWVTFDAVSEKATGKKLTTGPRGGGRTVAKIVDHVAEAERAYLSKLGVRVKGGGTDARREAMVTAITTLAQGEEISEEMRSRVKKPWSPRYAIRRSAWHALDHAWEIEDRSPSAQPRKTDPRKRT